VLPDGSVWLGQDAFAEAVLSQPLQQLDDADPAYATGIYVPHAFGPLPGQSYQGQKVGCAQYKISPDAAFLRLWFLDGATTDLDGGNLRRGLAQLIKETLRVDWYGTYPGNVVLQRPDGTLDIQLDTTLIPPPTGAPYRVFCPGAKLSIPAGSRVEVRFDNADPTKPVAYLFDPGPATLGVARMGDSVDVGTLVFSAVGMGVLTGTYTPPGGSPMPFSLGTPILLAGQISSASNKVFLPS
jgi:hypothetical protein